jgi:hypothetical protein
VWSVPGIQAFACIPGCGVVCGRLAAFGRGYGVRHRIFTLRVKYSAPDTCEYSVPGT